MNQGDSRNINNTCLRHMHIVTGNNLMMLIDFCNLLFAYCPDGLYTAIKLAGSRSRGRKSHKLSLRSCKAFDRHQAINSFTASD
jgi:hypothetical protein